MYGTIGQLLWAAQNGESEARTRVDSVFGPAFHTVQGWLDFLDAYIPQGEVEALLGRPTNYWQREHFQALFVACWIFHPTEKGSYMLRLDTSAQYINVRGAYDRLLATKGLEARISSHLSKKGASANQGWRFLRGYEELLIQMEGTQGGAPYLFLKCEGAPMKGLKSTVEHGADWIHKARYGYGKCYSPALNTLSKETNLVEQRAAENFSKCYEDNLLKKLGLSGTMVTVASVVDRLCAKTGKSPLPEALKSNTHLLGKAMQGSSGYIAHFKARKEVLAKKGIEFTAELEGELLDLAKRMSATSVSHAQQHYNEVRVTADEVSLALTVFREMTTGAFSQFAQRV